MLAECQPPHVGVHAVGSDDQAERIEDDGRLLRPAKSRVSRCQARLRPIPAGRIGLFSDAPGRALRQGSLVTGEETAGTRGGTMNHTVTQGPLTRIGRRVAAIVAECNYAQTRVDSLRNTPDAYLSQGR
jgi:hypothetical protein